MQKGKPKGFQRTVGVRDKNLGHLIQKSMTLSSSLPCWGHPAKDTGWLCKAGWVCAVVCPPQQAPPGVGTRTALQSDFFPILPSDSYKEGRWALESPTSDPFSSLDGSISAHSPSPSLELLGWGRQCKTWAQQELWSAQTWA